MPSWTAENEVKLLLTVIKTTNPKISRATWDEIATAMGATYTFESVRQKYQNLKRDSEALDRGPGPDGSKATNSTTTKNKTANKKRKAASTATDDEEDFENPAKVRKLKAEKTKVEDEGCIKVKTEAELYADEIIDEA